MITRQFDTALTINDESLTFVVEIDIYKGEGFGCSAPDCDDAEYEINVCYAAFDERHTAQRFTQEQAIAIFESQVRGTPEFNEWLETEGWNAYC